MTHLSLTTCARAHVRKNMSLKTAALLTLVACKPEPALQSPAPVAEPVTAAPADPGTTGEPEPEPPGPDQAITDPAPDERGPAVAPAPAPTPAPTISAAREPLPAALNTRIDASCGNDPGVGTAAKPFTLKTPDGKDISLASHRGKVVLLNFWGTWCKPCLKELPEFDRLYRRYRKHGLVLIAVATDTEPAKVLEFASERKLAAKLALGGEPLAEQYASTSFPFSLVIDDRGQIRGSYRGYRPECAGKLEQDLRAALERLP